MDRKLRPWGMGGLRALLTIGLLIVSLVLSSDPVFASSGGAESSAVSRAVIRVGESACKIHWEPYPDSVGNGFSPILIITNTGQITINAWSLRFALAVGQNITDGFWTDYEISGRLVTARDVPQNKVVDPGLSIMIGFRGTYTPTPEAPAPVAPPAFGLNTVDCSIF